MGWRELFGSEYDVPDEITTLLFMHDNSCGNDACPCFATDEAELRIYIEHPVPTKRESGGPRFTINLWRPDENTPDIIWEGDSVDEAVAKLRSTYQEFFKRPAPAGNMADTWFTKAKIKITDDMRANLLGPHVITFADLYRYVDANAYLVEALEGGVGTTPLDKLHHVQRLQRRLDQWIRDGGLNHVKPTVFLIPGMVQATWRDGKIEEITFTPPPDAAAEYVRGPDKDLDTADVEGPFWTAAQEFLSAGGGIEWVE